MSEPLIRLKGIERRYQSGEHEVTVLHPLDLAIDAGEMVAIVGASGSGKSTLMNILGCLSRPTSGSYRIAGRGHRLHELSRFVREEGRWFYVDGELS